jgi:surface protein
MSEMFHNAAAFNQDIGNWNTANVTNMLLMFWGAKTFNQDLSRWEIAACVEGIFHGSGMSKKNSLKFNSIEMECEVPKVPKIPAILAIEVRIF